MPEIGEYRRDAKNQNSWWTICKECGNGFWGAGYLQCITCFLKPGHKYTHPGGLVYLKLGEDDPYYTMSIRMGTLGDGWVNEARYVMAQHLGRLLVETDFVYRKNGKKGDNRIENLTLKMPSKNRRKMIRAKMARR